MEMESCARTNSLCSNHQPTDAFFPSYSHLPPGECTYHSHALPPLLHLLVLLCPPPPPPTSMDPVAPVHRTTLLRQISIDYTPDACHHFPELNAIHLSYDHRGGARWRTPHRFLHGTFSAKIRSPSGDTSGLNFNLYLSSLEGEKTQDEIDFEFLGKDKTIVQTNYYVDGVGGREAVHELGFDSGEEFHEYVMRWEEGWIEWEVDGVVLRREERRDGEGFPRKPMFLYASVWDASYVDEGRWTGTYVGTHAPYVCWYRDVKIPTETVVAEEDEEKKVVDG